MAFSDKIADLVTFFSKIRNKSKVYDTAKKELDLTKVLSSEDLERIVTSFSGTSGYDSIFNKFFDLNLGRADRYAEYDQIYYRIPEAAAAVHILVDLILSPNIGDVNNQLKYFPKEGKLGEKAEYFSRALLEQSTFVDHLPKIIFNTLYFGDCFVSNRKTNYGIQYTIHDTKETSILFDRATGINLGIVVRVPKIESALDKILSMACPSISLDLPRKTVGIVASKRKSIKTVNDYVYETKVKEIEDLISEMLYVTNNNNSIDFKYFPPGRYSNFSIYYNDFYHPYGTSIFDSLRSTAKNLLLSEAALSIYRMTRAPLRYKFLVEVGGVPEKNIRGLLQSIKDGISRDRVISESNTASIDTIPDMLAPEENFWIPVINGTPHFDIQQLEGASLDQFVGDVEYFKKKFIAGLGLPPAYLGNEEGTSTRALLTLEDMRLTRTIKKYQRDINVGLTTTNDNNLQLAKAPELIGQVQVQLPAPTGLEDTVRVENLAGKLGTAGEFHSMFPNVPKLYIMKKIVCMEQSEIDEMESMIEEQKTYKIFNEHPAGKIGPDGSDDMGGGFSGGMGSGGFDDMGDFSTDADTELGAMDNGDSELQDIDFGEEGVGDDSGGFGAPGEGEISL